MIVVFGSINLDLIFPVPHLPQPGETVLGEDGSVEPGGKGANQALAARRDGSTVLFAGAVGEDRLAEPALAGLTEAGVNLSRVQRLGAATGRAAICVDPNARNMIAVAAGANRLARADQVEDGILGPETTLLLQMETCAEQNAILIRRARARGARIILNLGPARPIAADALRAVDILVGNKGEIAWAGERLGTGNNAASLHAALGVTTIRTLGVQGAEAVGDFGYRKMPALPVEARDSTAAGDCFTGVLAAALDQGDDLPTALRRAAVAAALSTTRLGSQRSLPTATETDAALTHAPAVTSKQPEVED